MHFGTPRGKLKVNTGHPGGFGFLGYGTLTFQGANIVLSATKRIPFEWTFFVGLLCVPILLHLAYYYYCMQGPMGTLFSLPLAGSLVPRSGSALIGGATVCNVLLAGTRIQFTSSRDGDPQPRTVFLQAASTVDAEALSARLSSLRNA